MGSSFSGSVFGFRVFCPPIPCGLVPLRPCMLMNDFGLDHKHDDHVQKIEASWHAQRDGQKRLDAENMQGAMEEYLSTRWKEQRLV